MRKIEITAFELAQRFVGETEVKGALANPQVVAMLRLVDKSIKGDETPWCSAFVNYIEYLLRLPRSKSLAARSNLLVGRPISLDEAEAGFDVVVLNRAGGDPDPTVIKSPGHVGFFAGVSPGRVIILGGNQGDSVSVASFDVGRLLGVRRVFE